MNKYEYIIFDIDDTLFRYKSADRHIMGRIFEEENRYIDETDMEELQEKYHKYYHRHLYEYMDKIL